MDDKTITIDAGGVLFKTLKTTLTHSSSYFRSKLSRWTNYNEILFLDLDPDDFRSVLNYLRDSSNPPPRQNLLDYFGIEVKIVTLPEKPDILPLLDGPAKPFELPTASVMFPLLAMGIYDSQLNKPESYGPNTLFDKCHYFFEKSIEFNQTCNINCKADIYSKIAIKVRMDGVPTNFDKFNLINKIKVSTKSLVKEFSQTDLRIYHIIQKLDKFDEVEQQTNVYYIYIPIEYKISIGESILDIFVEINDKYDINKDYQLKFTSKGHFLDGIERHNLLDNKYSFRSLEWHPVLLNNIKKSDGSISDHVHVNEYNISSHYITKSINIYFPEDIIIYQLIFKCCGSPLISLDQYDLERYQAEHDFDYRVNRVFTIHMQPHLNFNRADNIEIILVTNQKDLGDLLGLSQIYYDRTYVNNIKEWLDCFELQRTIF